MTDSASRIASAQAASSPPLPPTACNLRPRISPGISALKRVLVVVGPRIQEYARRRAEEAGRSAEPPLRRPFSILAVDPAEDAFSVFIKAVGPGSRALCALAPGDEAAVDRCAVRVVELPHAGAERELVPRRRQCRRADLDAAGCRRMTAPFAEIDPDLADTAALTEAYDLPDERAAFERLAEVAAEVRAVVPGATYVSAGMSGDLEEALACGATHVRVGGAILGNRPTNG